MWMVRVLFASAVLSAVIAGAVLAAEFKLYPGAHEDDWSRTMAQQARTVAAAAAPGRRVDVYVTGDTYEQVYAFYKALGPEDPTTQGTLPALQRMMPAGQQLHMAVFLLDDAPSLSKSKAWVKVQRPAVADFASKQMRDVTLIEVVRDQAP